MARKYWRYRRNNKSEDPLASLFAIAVLGIAAYLYTHRQEVVSWLFIIAGVLIIGAIAYSFFKKFKKAATLGWDDDKILYMLKGMSPAQFESEVAKMFEALGYKTEVVGGANDGGIDVVARKEGKKYFIQCKKFITREATPHDVRDFLGAITNIKNPAEKGFFVTTNKFTLMAEKTFRRPFARFVHGSWRSLMTCLDSSPALLWMR